jgi:hypothetical protein
VKIELVMEKFEFWGLEAVLGFEIGEEEDEVRVY